MKVCIFLVFILSAVYGHVGFVDSYPWSSVFNPASWQRGQVLSDFYILFWNVDQTVGTITFAAVVNQNVGWVGFGISDNGGMKGADIAVLQKDSNGNFFIEDRFATDYVEPTLDTIQNVALTSDLTGVYGNVTIFVFTRSLVSCDKDQDFDIQEGVPNHIIFSHGTSYVFGYHGTDNRGGQVVWLLDNYVAPPTPPDAQTLVLQTTPFNVPSDTTTYMCTYFGDNLPTDRKYHVVEVDPIATQTFIHHMILYLCQSPLNYTAPFACPSMPSSCQSFWTGWAVGALNVTFPAVAGLPMGAGNESAKWLVLQVHYNNPNGYSNLVDTGSGFTLIYTPTLRPNDIGTLMIGAVNIRIPGDDPSISLFGQCPSSCTNRFPYPLNVISAGIHMHTLGQSAYTQQIRNGVELQRLINLPYYDFQFQSEAPVKNGTLIMPGDLLIHHCIWDSVGKTQLTTYGESTSNEMCFNFIVYYPKITIDQCFSVNTSVDGINLNVQCRDSSQKIGLSSFANYDTSSYIPLPPVVTNCSASASGGQSNTAGSQTSVNHSVAGKLEIVLVVAAFLMFLVM